MYSHNENSIFIVRYRLNGSKELVEKNFNSEAEAYGFYHGLENVDFKCFKIKTIFTMHTVVLYERFNNE